MKNFNLGTLASLFSPPFSSLLGTPFNTLSLRLTWGLCQLIRKPPARMIGYPHVFDPGYFVPGVRRGVYSTSPMAVGGPKQD